MLQITPEDSARRTARILYATRLKKHVPLQALRSSLMRRAVAQAFPQAYAPGTMYASFCGLLSCSVGSLRHWLHGRRNMPDRVRLILIATIRARIESGLAVLAELEAVEPKPHSPAANLHGAKARAAKAADD